MIFTVHRIVALLFLTSAASLLYAEESDRRDVRKGNREFDDGNFREAVVDYQKALLRDSTSFAASYNMANALYRLDNVAEGKKILDTLAAVAPESEYAADYYYNLGNAAAAMEDWQAAVDAYAQSLLRNPGDMDAKENYVYARGKLKDQQNGGGQNDQDQNNDQNDQDKNDQDNQNNDSQDRNNDGNQNQDQDQNGQNNDDRNGSGQGEQPKITPQAAQQMLKAIQAKEKETQEKVNKEKAAVMKSRQKEKNW